MERNPHLHSVLLSVGVLWNETSNRVWVDTNGDGSFNDQHALRDYGETHDIDWFGEVEGEDDNRIPFGVKIDARRRAGFLTLAHGSHGAYVAGPLAGNRLTGGLFDGAAPNAQLIDVRSKPRLVAFLAALARPDVDVVNWAGGWAQPVDDNGENDFDRRLMERAIALYNKPMACTCGMANALNALDYQSARMLQQNKHLLPPYSENMTGAPWFTRDGLQNMVLVPSTSLVTESRYIPGMFIWDGDKRMNISGDFLNPPAPPGYMIGANPSPTIPVMSGVLADLISEARRARIRYDGARLTQAVRISARQMKDFPTSQQVFGLVDAAAAWDQLSSMSRADDPVNPVLTSFRVARMERGRFTPVYGFNADIPEARGILPAELWLTRTGGYAAARKYRISLRGDDGTYRVLDENVSFVRSRPTRVRFTAKLSPGLHIAFLRLKDVQTNAVMHEVPLTVRVPDMPKMVAPWVEEYEAKIPPRRYASQYLRFEADTQAARYVTHMPFPGHHGLFGLLPGNPRINNDEPVGAPIDPAHKRSMSKTRIVLSLVLAIGASCLVAAQSGTPQPTSSVAAPPLYLNPDAPLEERVNDLVSRMTLEEKISQTGNNAPAIPRLGVPAYGWANEALHGVALAGHATVFPQAIGLAATWDTDLMHRAADIISTEARAKHNDAVQHGNFGEHYGLDFWSPPNINIFRDPRWGRGQETYGEDPFLTARMAVAFVTGLQGDNATYLKTISTPKHFAVHSGPEVWRHEFDALPSAHDLADTYTPAFRAAVVEGKAASVMCAYSAVDGAPACVNDRLFDLLRNKWGFRSYVVSDCGAIGDIYTGHNYVATLPQAAAVSVKAGTDLNCGNGYYSLRYAVSDRLISREEIDRAVKRLFEARFRLGMFDPAERVPWFRLTLADNDTAEDRRRPTTNWAGTNVRCWRTNCFPHHLRGNFAGIEHPHRCRNRTWWR